MKNFLILILLFSSCVSSKQGTKIVVLDGTASRVIGGDGSGYIKSVKWKQLSGTPHTINNSDSIVTQTEISINSIASWELSGVDNKNNIGKDTLILKN